MVPSQTQPRWVLMSRGVLLGLSFSLLLPCPSHSPQPSYEIVIPRRLGPKAGRGSQDHVSYLISSPGVNYTIHLKQKDFVVKNFPIFIHDPQGELMAKQHHVPAGCYYQGYVEGIPGSLVTLTTCSGLRGLLQLGNSSYSIEPLARSTKDEHLLLQREQVVPGRVMYKTPSEGGHLPGPGKATGQLQPWEHTRYLELLIVVDKEGFDAFGRSITHVTLEVLEILNLVDGLFYPLHLRVLMTALEVWVEKNPISVTENIGEVLHGFTLWRRRRSHLHTMRDVGCLFASVGFAQGVGASHVGGQANFGSVCDRKGASAVVSFARWPSMDTALHVARALGYLLGMEHDGGSCSCGNTSKCIMSTHGTVNYQFSNCSKKDYLDFLASGRGFCLQNTPEPMVAFALQQCGNGVLDAGEECDCGSEAQCELDLCCDSTCQKKEGAVCTSGGCCKNCQPLPAGEVCRESAGPCDLPEYCTGTSGHCPADVAKQDGTVCAEDGHCYSGQCQSRTLQCMSIFGEEAQPAPPPCFQEVTTKGGGFGGCWGRGADVKVQNCTLENALCGRVQCTNVGQLPQLEDHTSIIQTPVGNVWCWGINYHLGVESLDAGVIKDGTRCGERKICINWTCVPEEKFLASPCSAERTCGGRGVCNTRGHCHCAKGWAPPYCSSPGFGGSIDSGPAPITRKGLFSLTTRVTIIISALLVLAALVIVAVRKLRGTQAPTRLVGCFGAKEQGPEEGVKEQVEEGGSKPAASPV